MGHGCGSFGVTGSGGECEGVVVAAEVVALAFLGCVVGPVGVEVAAGVDGAELQDGLDAAGAPAGAGDAGPVADQVAAGAFDDAGGDRPAAGQRLGVVQVGLLVLQVGQGRADDLGVLAAGPGRLGCGQVPDPGDDLRGAAVQDVQFLGGDPGLDGRVARGVEAPGGLPQVFLYVDEVDQDRDGDVPLRGLVLDQADLVVVPVGQRDPGPGPAGVAAVGLAEHDADRVGQPGGDIGGVPLAGRLRRRRGFLAGLAAQDLLRGPPRLPGAGGG